MNKGDRRAVNGADLRPVMTPYGAGWLLEGRLVVAPRGLAPATFAPYSFVIPSGLATSSTGFVIKDGGNANVVLLFRVDDVNDAPIFWINNAGGMYLTDNFAVSKTVYDYTWKLGAGQSGYGEVLRGFGAQITITGLPDPTSVSASAIAGGTLTASTQFFYKIVPFNYQATVPGSGLSVARGVGTETNITTTGSNKTASVSWARGTDTVGTNGTAGWYVYRATSSGGYTATSYLTTVTNNGAGSGSPSFTDDGSIALTAGPGGTVPNGAPPAAPEGLTRLRLQRWPGAVSTDPLVELRSEFGTVVGAWQSTGDVQGSRICPGASGGGTQTSGFYHDTGVPSNANGANLDWDISDKGILYFKQAGAWNPYAQDGWVYDTNTWTYASATTFTLAVDATGYLTKGTKVSYNDGAVDYGVVASSVFSAGTTTVTLITTSDYSIANATLSTPRYSYAATPQGYPTWFNWSPTLAGYSANPTNTVNRWMCPGGNTIRLDIRHGTAGTSNNATHTATLPVTAATITNMQWQTVVLATDGATGAQAGLLVVASAGTTVSLHGILATATSTNNGSSRINAGFVEYEF